MGAVLPNSHFPASLTLSNGRSTYIVKNIKCLFNVNVHQFLVGLENVDCIYSDINFLSQRHNRPLFIRILTESAHWADLVSKVCPTPIYKGEGKIFNV